MEETIRKIDLALRKKGKTRSDLANYLHMSRQTISKIMRGTRKLHLDELIKIAEFLELPPADILGAQYCEKKQYSALIDAYNAGKLQLTDVYSRMYNQYSYLLCLGTNEKELYACNQYVELLKEKIVEDYMHQGGYTYQKPEESLSLGNWIINTKR